MAKCPACKNVVLELSNFESSLPVMNCNSCGGSWLRANEYARWLKSQNPGSFDEGKTKEISNRFPVTESNKAAICPDCGHLLRKYKIGAKVDFHLDRCNNCNGVWLDKNEWDSLKTADLHDEINQFFTKPWQQHIQDKTTASKFDAMYLERFGEGDYHKIKEIREWLQEHPNRNNLIAFLLGQRPVFNIIAAQHSRWGRAHIPSSFLRLIIFLAGRRSRPYLGVGTHRASRNPLGGFFEK